MSPRAAHIRRLAATVAVVVLLPAADAQALPTLHHGDRGGSVRKLQRALHLTDDGVGGGTWRMIRRSLHRRVRVASAGAGATVRTRGASVRVLQSHLGVAAD